MSGFPDASGLCRFAAGCVLALTLAACAHPVNIRPALVLSKDRSTLIDKKVGYQITDAQRALQSTTPGGGGDKISYFLYKDMEPGLFDTLSSVFSAVYVVPEKGANEFIVEKGLSFVFTPEFQSDSSSSNIVFWNPTDFTLKLRVKALDASGKQVWTREFSAQGKASAGGSLVETPAAQAAAVDVFKQLQQALLEEPVFRQ
jgi:hypothetical protein